MASICYTKINNNVHAVHYFHVLLPILHRNCTGIAKYATDMKRGKLVASLSLRGKSVSNLSWFEGGYTHVKTYSILDDRYKDSSRGLSDGRY